MPLHRRDFVECALGLAATALAGVDPRADAPSSRPQAGSGERLRVAIVGVNGRGKSHVAAWLAQPDADLVTICDCDPGAFVRLCEKGFDRSRRVPDFTTDFRRLLDRKDIDVVSIATPNHWHALMAVWAMQAGKDVYLEKPCSYTVEEGRVITQWARKLGRICQMGAQSRSMTGMRQTIDFVKSGRVGPVKVAHALCF
jgi:predicted dehydrogenase